MRVTSKGQVTIPIALREKAGILPNTEVEFGLRGGTITIERAKKYGKKLSKGEVVHAFRRCRISLSEHMSLLPDINC
jgi:AbrB family looped-hinge helix DNA binding protein